MATNTNVGSVTAKINSGATEWVYKKIKGSEIIQFQYKIWAAAHQDQGPGNGAIGGCYH